MVEKSEIRRELLGRRDSIPAEVRRVKDRLIMNSLIALEEFLAANTILLFAAFRSEVNTLPLIERVLMEGRRVLLPKVDPAARVLHLLEILAADEVMPGYMGIPEPAAAAPGRQRSVDDADVVIVPGAGFDLSGNRIGYGGGYYDRLLSGLRKAVPVVAPAYEEQVVDALPAEPHDRKVDVIVTDRRVIRIAAGS